MFKNKEKFREWLKSVLKEKYSKALEYDIVFESWLNDVMKESNEKDSSHYEVSKLLTKTGNPETIYYYVSIIEREGEFEKVITF